MKNNWFYAAAAASGALVLVLANLHELWRPWTNGVVTYAWPKFLWAVNVAALMQLIGNGVLALRRPEVLRRTVEWLLAAAALGVAIAFVAVFPIEVARVGGPWLDFTLRIVGVLGIAGAGLALLVQTVRVLKVPRPPRTV